MSSFTGFDKALVIEYKGPGKRIHPLWKVVQGFEYYLDNNPDLYVRVPDGFVTDGATVPRVLWGLLPPWDVYGQAAVLHDYLLEYGWVLSRTTDQTYRVSRDEARRHFSDAMRILGVPRWKRYLMIGGVWLFDQYRKVIPYRG